MLWALVVVTLGAPPHADPKSMVERPERYATQEQCEEIGREVVRKANGLAFTMCEPRQAVADKQAMR